jgi:DNA-binding transcriptional ArsR family regulator
MHALDALGSPIRREILVRLQVRPATVGEIAEFFPVSRPAISRHLSMLRRAGLVSTHRTDARTLYAVRVAGFQPVRAYLDGFWDVALERLSELSKKGPRKR